MYPACVIGWTRVAGPDVIAITGRLPPGVPTALNGTYWLRRIPCPRHGHGSRTHELPVLTLVCCEICGVLGPTEETWGTSRQAFTLAVISNTAAAASGRLCCVESLDLEGMFWPAGSPGTTVAGRLEFSATNGAELALMGSFQGVESMFAEERRAIRILGIAGKKVLTLEDCQESGSTLEMPGIYRQRYRPSLVLAGAHFDADEPLTFSAVTIRTRHLEHWVSHSGITLEMTEKNGDITKIQLTHTPLRSSNASSGLQDVELGFTWGVRGDHLVESVLTQACYLRVTPSELLSLDVFVRIAMSIQHLVTLGVDATAPITSIGFWHPDVVHQVGERTLHDSIYLYSQLQGSDSVPATTARLRHDMLFSFDDIGGVDGVGRWIRAAEKFEPVVGALLSHRYMPRMYMDNRLQNVVFAAETFHRLEFRNHVLPRSEFRHQVREIIANVPDDYRGWLREQLQYSNEPRLRQRLIELAEYVGSPFAGLVGNVNQWATAVKNARNQSVHVSPKRRTKSVADRGPSLYLLSESVYFLVALCLLKKSGVSESTLSGVEQHQRYLWLARQLTA